ncbi:hypothetical protein EDEG_02910 [Edhazardia aedis USNM 41457]|uniref:Uncharacterized protein n=1 Tax=Edhazardia aedis (strain USNM 41457) TaxID=1003232 RepID=J8ZSP3_EDHAE|nr:hypothetical protein EDEG_02910 [Edhazardia aedis USNM 41457]|eukprot:EJW02678.1 hypothetical protein EDEG_02910 [Edhazardia aedis USNM 41457]
MKKMLLAVLFFSFSRCSSDDLENFRKERIFDSNSSSSSCDGKLVICNEKMNEQNPSSNETITKDVVETNNSLSKQNGISKNIIPKMQKNNTKVCDNTDYHDCQSSNSIGMFFHLNQEQGNQSNHHNVFVYSDHEIVDKKIDCKKCIPDKLNIPVGKSMKNTTDSLLGQFELLFDSTFNPLVAETKIETNLTVKEDDNDNNKDKKNSTLDIYPSKKMDQEGYEIDKSEKNSFTDHKKPFQACSSQISDAQIELQKKMKNSKHFLKDRPSIDTIADMLAHKMSKKQFDEVRQQKQCDTQEQASISNRVIGSATPDLLGYSLKSTKCKRKKCNYDEINFANPISITYSGNIRNEACKRIKQDCPIEKSLPSLHYIKHHNQKNTGVEFFQHKNLINPFSPNILNSAEWSNAIDLANKYFTDPQITTHKKYLSHSSGYYPINQPDIFHFSQPSSLKCAPKTSRFAADDTFYKYVNTTDFSFENQDERTTFTEYSYKKLNKLGTLCGNANLKPRNFSIKKETSRYTISKLPKRSKSAQCNSKDVEIEFLDFEDLRKQLESHDIRIDFNIITNA